MLLFGLVQWLLASTVFAATSANYTLVPETIDNGGRRTTSAIYTLDSSLAPGGVATSANYILRAGFVGSLNETPSDIVLNPGTVAQNQPSGTSVGTFTATDADPDDTYTFTLVSGTGSTDNASFTITGSTLKTAAVFDYATKNSYSIRMRMTDSSGSVFEKQFTIGVVTATVTLGNLSQIYNGTARTVSVTTAPPGLSVDLTYNGSTNAPANVGSYTVVGTISNTNYVGSAMNTLVIGKATATVTPGNLNQVYDGTARTVTVTTAPSGLSVDLTYNGSTAAPTNTGSYTVIGMVNDANYAGSATTTLVISPASASVMFSNLSQTYNGTARSVSVTTAPSGLSVSLTYNDSTYAPTNAGNYALIGTIIDTNYSGSSTNTLVIGKASAAVTLGNLNQTYNGAARNVSVTTAPPALLVNVTYNGSTNVATNAGNYTVIGTINDVNYQGGATNMLTISQAAATVTLGNLIQTYDGTARNVSVTTTPSGLSVSLTYNGSVNAPTNGGSYNVIATINTVNYLGGATNILVVAPPTSFVNGSPLSVARSGHIATLLPNGKVLVAGGVGSSGPLSSAELYDPALGTWTATGSMTHHRYGPTATMLPSGNVLVAGGDNGGSLSSAELYDPATGLWTTTGGLNNARQQHTATLLPDGKVLVTGGFNGTSGFLSVTELYDPATGLWTTTGGLNNARQQHAATLLPNGKVLVTGGVGSTGPLSSAEIYDPATGLWSLTGSLSIARQQHTATLLPNGKVLLAGGYNGGVLSSAELYDPASGTWTGTTNTLRAARYNHAATLLPNGRLLVAGGVDSGGSLSIAELYDPATGLWTLTGALSTARQSETMTLLSNGKVLVVGGVGSSGPLSVSELYDPAAGSWTTTGALNISRAQHTATLLPNGKVLLAGGLNGGGNLASAELYDPATGFWTATGSMGKTRQQHTATLLRSGKLLVAGGYNGSYLLNVEVYDPATGTWTATGSLSTARQAHTATLLANGKVLVAGGWNGSSLSSAQLYDPATGTWTVTGALTIARYGHTATLLPNGMVLITAGYNGGVLSSSELYDPVTGTWSATGALNTPRSAHATRLLPNGKVLVMGGYDNAFNSLSSAELYDPATGLWSATGVLGIARYYHAATLLPNGKVLVSGGYGVNGANDYLSSAELYDPATGMWTATDALSAARDLHTATLLPNGKVLVVGGQNSSGILSSAGVYDVGLGFSTSWQPQIATFTSPLGLGGSLRLTGSRYRGISAASGGNSQDSSSDYPVVQLRSVESGQTLSLLPLSWSTNSYNSAAVTNFPTGWAMATLFVNGIPGTAIILNVKLGATVTLSNLSQTYSGTARSVSATTVPSGLSVSFTYNGSANAPTNVGSYAVVATINDANYAGSATNTLVIMASVALSTPRYVHTATLLPNGKVLVVGGNNGTTSLSSAELYDPSTGTWTLTGSLSTARQSHTATLLPNGKVLVAGGSNGSTLSSAELYDPSTGTWTLTGTLNTSRYAHTATLLANGKVLVAGGYSGGTLASAELYDPATGIWSTTGSLIKERHYFTAILLPNGKVLVAGGETYNVYAILSSAELYDPAAGTWTATGPLNTARVNHTATLLPGGKVVAGGGIGNSGPLSDAELYDPASGSWLSTGALNTARYLHTATLLPNGKLLVVGGNDGSSSLSSGEMYNPATGAWTSAGALNTARYLHTATLLPNGKLLVVAGYNGSALSSAELYEFVSPPQISSQPTNQTVLAGGNVTFSVTASSLAPLAYQWLFNSNVIAGAANASLTISNAQIANAGNYQVVITNAFGSTTSQVAILAVTLPAGYNQMSARLLGNGSVELSFVGIPGANYALERTASLSPTSWVSLATNSAGPVGILLFTDTPNPNTNCFWRIRSVP